MTEVLKDVKPLPGFVVSNIEVKMIPQTENNDARRTAAREENNENVPTPNQEHKSMASHGTRRLAAGDWLRAVAGFSAPFGHDGMPTVWG